MSKITIKHIAVSAICIALATVLSMLKLLEMPFGGSVTLFSMFFMCLPGMLFGWQIGIISGIAYGVLQFILGPYVVSPIQVVVDYIFAFGALGLSGIISFNKKRLALGYLIGITGRFIFAVISGVVFFAQYAPEGMNPLVYSAVYNGSYIYAEGIVTAIILLIPAVQMALERIVNSVNKA
jgi:probable proton-coupled thiamine transporter yuaJ